MKITINIPCSVKLSTDNYCTKCDHQIPDLSSLSKSDAINRIKRENINCAIFNKDQFINSNPLKNIYNIVAISAASLLLPQVNAQEYIYQNVEDKNQTINTLKKEISFQIISQNSADDETFRLLINDEVVLTEFKANQDYIVKFEIEKNSDINIRVASNSYREDMIKTYTTDKLPKKIIVSRDEFKIKPIVMGKIIMKPNDYK